MTFGNRLKNARTIKKLTQKQLANLIGAKHNSVSDWENDKNKPDPDTIELLCGVLEITPNYLLNAKGDNMTPEEKEILEKYRDLDPYGKKAVDSILHIESERMKNSTSLVKEEISEPKIGKRLINYYQRLASAGTGQIVFDTLPTELIEIPNIPSYRKANYAIGVKGNSMLPLYNDNDILLVEMTDTIGIGEIGIFLTDGKSYVKKLGHKELISVNDEYDNIPLTEDSRCMGRVIGKL